MLSDSIVENLVRTGDQKAVVYRSEYGELANPPVHLGPGESVFLPTYAPHRVTNDDCVCISWNVGFNTAKSARRKKIHLVNYQLRKLGVQPTDYNKSARLDNVKHKLYFMARVSNKIQNILDRSD